MFGKVHGVIGPSAQLSVQAIHTYDRGTIGEDVREEVNGALVGQAPEEVGYRNTAAGLRFLYLPNTSALRAEVLVNVSSLESEQGVSDFRDEPVRESSVGRLNAQTNLTYYLPSVDVKAGVFVRTNRIESNLRNAGGTDEREYFTEAGAFIEPEGPAGRALGPGRAPGPELPQRRPGLPRAPRAGRVPGRHPRGLGRWRALPPERLIGVNDRRDVANVFTAWTRADDDAVPSAWHGIAGYRVTPTPWLELVAEGYYKKLSDFRVAEWTALPRFTTTTQGAEGEVVGLDTRVELRFDNAYAYLTYGLSEVTYDAQGPNLELWYGTETLEYNPPHDRRHQVNALVSTTLLGVDLAARVSFGVGAPVHAGARVRPVRLAEPAGRGVRDARRVPRHLRAALQRAPAHVPPPRPLGRPDVPALARRRPHGPGRRHQCV